MRRSLEERDAAVNLANAARDQAVQEVESRGHQLGATRAQLEQLQEEHNQILQDCQARQRCPMCAAPFELSDVWSATAFVRTGYETGSRVTRTIASPRGSESDSGDSACKPCVVTASVVISKCGSHATGDDSRLLTTTSCFFSDVPPG